MHLRIIWRLAFGPIFGRVDMDAGLVDQIVVYKVNHLTRSLTDFSKLVEKLDAAGASFVSVTQSFNSATSMGRLRFNMPLSFAQFEREVTAERIRDKIAHKGRVYEGQQRAIIDKTSWDSHRLPEF
jgi:DNA invertase Pin-like site-specific DNA recombinase